MPGSREAAGALTMCLVTDLFCFFLRLHSGLFLFLSPLAPHPVSPPPTLPCAPGCPVCRLSAGGSALPPQCLQRPPQPCPAQPPGPPRLPSTGRSRFPPVARPGCTAVSHSVQAVGSEGLPKPGSPSGSGEVLDSWAVKSFVLSPGERERAGRASPVNQRQAGDVGPSYACTPLRVDVSHDVVAK